MFTIIQSHRTERLVEHLLDAYKAKNQPIFAEFTVIVPSMVLGDWLDKSIASQAGISTLVTTTFWGQYQWQLMQKVLAQHNDWLEQQDRAQQAISVPEVAVLTGSVMQWRLFGYFTYYQDQIMGDQNHPLYPQLSALLDDKADRSQREARLWSLATDFSRVFGRYLTHRAAWLDLWSANKPVDVELLINDKDQLTQKFDQYAGMTPEWLVAHYKELEAAQRHLWHLLFAAVYEHRAAIETRFWQIMGSEKSDNRLESELESRLKSGVDIQAILPKQLHIFTIQQLPQTELNFLQRLSQYIDITLLHYNPSQLFWADIVDKQWLQRQRVINPQTVFLRDYGHTLLSRLGKQSRETFAMLASLSGNEDKDGFKLDWQDRFDDETHLENVSYSNSTEPPLSLLAHLQQDVLMLDEGATQQTTAGRLSAALGTQMDLSLEEDYSDDALKSKHGLQTRQHWQLSEYDNSLSIHSCHSLQRQLEVLRSMIGRWLNEPNSNGSRRHLSDIVVLLPDVERHHDLISSVFVSGQGQDGLTLPAKVTGIVDKWIRQLWEAISGFYSHLGSENARFEAAQILDWLMLPPLYESLGLTHEQMSRACDLLEQAGFVRGFDEAHLQQSLEGQDYDYRFSFAYALDQIALGLVMPQADISDCLYPDDWQDNTLMEKTVPIAAISLADAPMVEALCRVHASLDACRNEYQARYKAEEWLNRIEAQIIHPLFGALDQTRPMRAIFNAMNGFKSSLRANRHYQRYHIISDAPNDDNGFTDNPVTNQGEASNALQVEARLAQVSTLPLKLSFMLDSIEDELESQQVSAEPTGVITFGRFGALRNVPFGLVVMLNMDLSEFPNQDRDNRYDLMKAGLSQRGDRSSEDDDNGAFLDALLCARSACWIFYNGQRLTDNHEHLPANPVSELLQFLQADEVQWQWQPLTQAQGELDKIATNEPDKLAEQVQRYLPKLIEQWLVTRHPALPFADEVFVSKPVVPQGEDNTPEWLQALKQAMQREKLNQQSNNAPAKVWQDVFERLQARADNASKISKVNLPTLAEYHAIAKCIVSDQDKKQLATSAPDYLDSSILKSPLLTSNQIDMQYLYQQVRHPAKHFLREQQVHIVLPTDDTRYQEPLALSGLGAYQITAELLSNLQNNTSISATAVNKFTDNSSVDTDDSLDQTMSKHVNRLLYHPVMPAGVARQSTLDYQQLQLTQQCQDFATQLANLGIDTNAETAASKNADLDIIDGNSSSTVTVHKLALLTPCAETMISVNAPDMPANATLQIKGVIPHSYKLVDNNAHLDNEGLTNTTDSNTPVTLWLNILPNSARTQHLLRFWLAHVYWQVARRTTAQQVAHDDGRSIWRFKRASSEHKKFEHKTTFELVPIAYDQALAELMKWIRFAKLAGESPIVLLPAQAISYIESVNKAQDEGSAYQPKRSDFDSWLWVGFNDETIYDTSSQHELWQYILQNHDAFNAMTDALSGLAQPLFTMMYESLTPLS